MKKILLLLTTIIFISCDQDDTTKFLLTTSADPEDAGTVLPSTRQYNDGDTAKLIASPSDGYLFESWTGATGDAETEILMDSDKTVVGNFAKIQFELTVNVVGEGTVSQKIIKAGLATKYDMGTIVELTATAAEGWEFEEWSGSVVGSSNPQQITLDKAKTVTAKFKSKAKYKLTIVNDGQGNVSTSIVKSGSANEYSSGTIVEVTAAPLAGWTFDKWSGAISGTVNPQQVTIDSDKTVIAEYKSLAPIVLDNDGITLKAKPDTAAGTTYEINGVTYTVVDNDMLKSWISADKDMSTAVTTLVTDMKEIFKGKSSFNDNISSWDCSNVISMEGMFEGASTFNKDISKWDTNKVTNMDKMFKSAAKFNQDLSNWCVVNLATEPTDFTTGSACETDKKPVWGTWPSCPLIGEWKMESWTNNTDNATFFSDGEKKCDDNPHDLLKINGGKDNYGTYSYTSFVCYTDGSPMSTDVEDGLWTYNGTNDQVKVGVNSQNMNVFNLTYTKDFNYFTVKYTEQDDDGASSREITEVWKRK